MPNLNSLVSGTAERLYREARARLAMESSSPPTTVNPPTQINTSSTSEPMVNGSPRSYRSGPESPTQITEIEVQNSP